MAGGHSHGYGVRLSALQDAIEDGLPLHLCDSVLEGSKAV